MRRPLSKSVVFWLLMGTALGIHAAVHPGENLVVNGRFETDQTVWPIGWRVSPSTENMRHLAAGGPGGLPAMSWENPAEKPLPEVVYRQGGMKLSSNGTYRVSGWVRQRDFAGYAEIVVINAGWQIARGLAKLPVGTRDWQKFETTFRGFPSSNGYYEILIRLAGIRGRMDFADLRLEAMDEAALRASERAVGRGGGKPRLVPWRPLLCRIPETNRVVTFRFFGRLPGGKSCADCDLSVRYSAADGRERASGDPQVLVKGDNTVRLPDDATGGRLMLAVVSREDGKTLCEESFDYRVIPSDRPVDASGQVKLNGLVTRLLRERLVPESGDRTFSFSRTGDGWIFLQVKTKSAVPDLKVTLDGSPVLDARYPRLETFRRVSGGDHTLTVAGCSSAGGVRIHAIPEIFNYCVNNAAVKENPKFDWDFQERHVLSAVTTLNGSDIPNERRAWFAERGYSWIGNLSANGLTNETELARRIAASPYMRGSPYAGVSLDEINLADDRRIDLVARSLRHYGRQATANVESVIYTWVYGKPQNEILAADFMATCVNQSAGRGRMLFEAYVATRETEELAEAGLRSGFRDAMIRFRKTYPLSIPNTGIVFGNFMQYPVLSLVHHPAVDFKHYLDMQLHLVANDPVFEGMGLVGYWGSYYIDEEHLRWAFALMRHYFVEGHTDRLSDRHGYVYHPELIVNPDFETGLDGWQVEGDITVSRHKGFGRVSEGRWSSGETPGDTYAVLKRGERGNCLSQKLKGLVPGKPYRLELMVADADDIDANRVNGRRFPVEVKLEGAACDAGRSWVHVAKTPRYFKTPSARVNLHHTVFRAEKSEAILKIADSAAPIGARHAVNGVVVCPYFE